MATRQVPSRKDKLSSRVVILAQSIPILPSDLDDGKSVQNFLTAATSAALGCTELFEKFDLGDNLDDSLSDLVVLVQYITDTVLAGNKIKMEALESIQRQLFQFLGTLFLTIECLKG